MPRFVCALSLSASALLAGAWVAAQDKTPAQSAPQGGPARAEGGVFPAGGSLAPFEIAVPSAAVKVTMVPIAGQEVEVADPTAPGQKKKIEVGPFWISKTEIPWEVFDVFVYRMELEDSSAAAGPDGVSRPSRPYLPPDRGFGHAGYAAISFSFHSAQKFCEWLSAKSGRKLGVPTEAQWAAALDPAERAVYGGEFGAKEALLGRAWYKDNCQGKPEAVGTKPANAHGVHDLLGNVADFCTDLAGKPVALGGSWRDSLEKLPAKMRTYQTSAWNASDPNIPKSTWWLTDCDFVGVRIVCTPDPTK